MKPLTELLMAVHDGEVDIEDLTEEQQEIVMDGYRELAEQLINDARFQELGNEILSVLKVTDPFDGAIQEAESRGSTYWELENEHVH